MRGFDRPLKPTWIYNFINEVEIGDKIRDHKEEFYKILWELDGREGKRKVSTVLTRYFLKSEDNPKSTVVEHTPIIDICKKYPLDEIKPLLLFYLLMRSAVLRTLTKSINNLYGSKEDINYTFLRKKVVKKYGDRDISARSLRNFLYTLESFDVLKKEKNKYKRKKLLFVNEMNACYMLKFYSEDYKKSPMINLDEIEDYLFLFFKMPNVEEIVKKYNGKLWEYSVRLNQKVILFNENFS